MATVVLPEGLFLIPAAILFDILLCFEVQFCYVFLAEIVTDFSEKFSRASPLTYLYTLLSFVKTGLTMPSVYAFLLVLAEVFLAKLSCFNCTCLRKEFLKPVVDASLFRSFSNTAARTSYIQAL